MKKQKLTHGTLASSATNSHLKGFQQYFTPEAWARALGGALPEHRRTIADLHCGSGTLVRGLANSTTRDVLGTDLDPAAGLGGKREWDTALPGMTAPPRTFQQGDVLDLYPLLAETETKFDLLALNPPFSLTWPLELVPEPLRKGLAGKTIDSTHATLRMIPELLTDRGEALLIANQSTLERLHEKFPEDFAQAWLWASMRTFFPGTSPDLRVGLLYFSGNHADTGPRQHALTPKRPDDLAVALDILRRQHFTAACIEQPWEADAGTARRFLACCDEMERRRNPAMSEANVTLDTDGRLRTWVSAYQEKSVTVPQNMVEFLRSIHRKLPLELTLQRGARLALQQAVACGIWTVDPAAADAIATALEDFDRDRAPLTPISDTQRIGWIDDAEELLCTRDFDHFRAGRRYPLSTETIEWKKEEERPRYHAGKRDTEQVLVRGHDLRLTLHPEGGMGKPVHFIFNPDRLTGETYSLEDLAAHFALPEVKDISTLHPERYQENLSLLDELESMTP